MPKRQPYFARIQGSALALIVAILATVTYVSASGTSQAAVSANIFGSTVPAVRADSDPDMVELGLQFKAAVAGKVTGVRFYKGAGNIGTHIGSLWQGPVRKAMGTFSNETATGWQTLTFASSVPITAGSIYTASYLAPKGHYAVDNPYSLPKSTGNLTAVKGVYKYGGGYPTDVYRTSNYWVDVVFDATTIPPSPTTTPASTIPGSSDPATPTTPPPTTTTTTPPTPRNNCVPVPSACGYPDATNTGARGALRRIPQDVSSGPGWRSSGSTVIVDGAGTLFQGFEISGDLNINADNVTVRNVKSSASGETFGIALRHGNNAVIEDVTIAPPSGAVRLLVGVKDIYGDAAGTIVRRTNISGTSTGIQIYEGTIVDNYIHDMGLRTGDHINGTTSNGGSRLMTIQHNTIFNQFPQTDAVSLFQDFGPEKNRIIDNNLLAGGGYTIYGGANAGKEANATGIKITNNRIGRQFFPKGGSYGWLAAWNPNGAGNVLKGNVWDDTGIAIN